MVIPSALRVARATRHSRDVRQHQSHLPLLAHTSARIPASLDAIIVPASRPAVNLDHAITLARKLRCQLVVLCSLNARVDEVNELLALRNFTQAVVADLPEGYRLPKLDLATSKRTSLDLPDSCVNPNGDLSTKRNIGLLLARMMGWQRIFFLDDDIRDLYSSDLREVAMMLGPCDTVGMRAVNFPDNSVVCHGHRKTGGFQDIFVSGSALAAHCTDAVPFFPEIYNEDWLFFYQAARERRLGLYGRDATQLWYDPFADPQRATGQEFGDIIAEGLYSLLHDRRGVDHATADYWRTFLKSRMRFLEGVHARAQRMEPYLRQRIVRSIEAAMDWSWQIKPSMCEHYITLWQHDLVTWQQRLNEIPRGLSAKAALEELNLTLSSPSPYVLAGMADGDVGAISVAAVTSGGRVPSSRGRAGDGVARGAISRAGHFILQAVAAQEPPEPEGTSRIEDGDQLRAGRHRENRPGPPQLRRRVTLKKRTLAGSRFLTEAGPTNGPTQLATLPSSPQDDLANPDPRRSLIGAI